MDTRIQQLAKNLIKNSVRLQKGEHLLIEVNDTGKELAKALMEEAYLVGGKPFLWVKDQDLMRTFLMGADQKQIDVMGQWEANLMEKMQAYIAIRGNDNPSDLSDIPAEAKKNFQTYWSRVVHTDLRLANTKWCVLRWPNPTMASHAKMSTQGFEDFYFDVCTLDYQKLEQAELPLKALFDRTKEVEIIGPGTHLKFSIENIPTVMSYGLRNVPDGEVFTAPVKDSVEGKITYNTPSIYQGVVHENVTLEFSKGKIVKATSNQSKHLEEIFTTDEGASFIGEFAIGVNPKIKQPMGDILFDEKITGSFHFTPGNAYLTADNGNRSSIHWDLVCIQTPEFGGGEIRFDGVTIRKDGCFVLPELEPLNPENW